MYFPNLDENKDVVEGKKTDVSTKKLKDRRWEDMAQQFRTKFKSTRTTSSLIQKWENVKKAAKKKLSLERQEVFKTGGGEAEKIVFTENEIKVIEIMGQAAKPLSNPFDSDAIADVAHNPIHSLLEYFVLEYFVEYFVFVRSILGGYVPLQFRLLSNRR